LIARPHEKSFRVLDGFTRIVRLGEGLSVTGRLSDAAMERTIEALKQCRNKLREHEPARMRLIATEACRAASNGEEFIARVKSELGMELEIVDRQTEASLAVTGCADLIEDASDGALMFDIGGGSSELAWLDFRGGRPRRQGRMAASIRSWQSLPVGVVSIAERFGGVEVTAESFEAMVAYVAGHLREFKGRGKLKQMIADHPVHLIGTSGTVTTLAGLHLGLERYERQKVDGLWMSRAEVDATMKALLAMPFDRRVGHPCIGRDRADLVLPGCAIFEAIRREWPTERVRVADRGLREGILISLMDEDRANQRRPQMARRG
jgi:exopolyphosphatase/guanosine-5'-triphosphate,3'-diphosphate pyrophosphatase